MKVNVYEAKTKLSQLLNRALVGEEIVIARHGKPLVRLVPVGEPRERMFGRFRGQFAVPENFDRDPEVERLFHESSLVPAAKRPRSRQRSRKYR